MSKALSDRVKKIPPSGIRAFFDLVLQSKGIISLGVGEPDFFTPWNIREEAIYRLEQGATTYTSNLGLLELRQEIAVYLEQKFSLQYSDQQILITNGVSEGVDIVCRSFLNPGDEVILPEPAYVCYRPLIELSGGKVVSIDTSSSQFVPLAAQIEAAITNKTKMIMLSYPNNPTGQSIPFSELSKIADLAVKHQLLILTDEIYAALSFEPFKSIAEIAAVKPNVIYLNGFSKAYSMTGWRIGYICADLEYIDAMNKIHQYSALCAPTLSQYAAVEACKNSEKDVVKMMQSYQERALYFTNMMNEVGLETVMPQGGIYCFTSVKKLGLTSLEFAEKLIKEKSVAVVPGSVFGQGGEGYFRACIATKFDSLQEAAQKIQEFVRAQ
jgi:aminotransferase